MKLKKVRVTNFQSVRDSNDFEIGDITCLVGKNEAGKTALLKALYRLRPIIDADKVFDVTDDYPRWDVTEYEHAVSTGQRRHAIVVTTSYELEEQDVSEPESMFGPELFVEKTIESSKGYDPKKPNGTHHLKVNEEAALKHILEREDFDETITSQLAACKNFRAVGDVLSKAEQTEAVKRLTTIVQSVIKDGLSAYVWATWLAKREPYFLYFDEYYQMLGRANIEALKQRIQANTLEASDRPLLGLINLARLDLDQLLNPTRTRALLNKLEGASNYLTQRIIKYWSQNRYLQLSFDVREGRPEDPVTMRQGHNIWGEVYDRKHLVTTELGTRSRGFVWFFSFLAWYSDVQSKGDPIVLLLDEPGLSLHAKAQQDLLRFFEAEVKGKHQLIYSTHSPFMIDPTHFDRVRIVQDLSIESDDDVPREKQGTKVLTDVLEATDDSLFPLQGALGYDITQTLFIGPNTLIVEGVSDLLFIQTISGLLQERDRTGLNSQWTITPVGGVDKVPTFVALVGAQKGLNVAVLIDFQTKDQQTIEGLYKRKLLEKKKVLTFSQFIGSTEADIEDMFEPSLYLGLVNGEFNKALSQEIKVSDLDANLPRVTRRLERYFEAHPLQGNNSFNHYRPARYFCEQIGNLKAKMSDTTLNRFEAVFKQLNEMLK